MAIASLLTLGWAGTKRGRSFLRRSASRLVAQALVLRSRSLRHAELLTVLVIAPHPDDESFGCGGTLALIANTNPSVHVLFITDGGASHPKHPVITPTILVATRVEEARLATQNLGIDWSHVTFMNEQDGSLSGLKEDRRRQVAGGIASLMAVVRPDAVFLPGRSDGSSEHEEAFALVREAIALAGVCPRILEFPVWSWWNPLLMARSVFAPQRIWRVDVRTARDAKARAMACYASQTTPIPPDTDPALPEGFALMFLGGYEFYIEH